jgi:hypothetical protein
MFRVLGRNTVIGPGLVDLSASVARKFRISERIGCSSGPNPGGVLSQFRSLTSSTGGEVVVLIPIRCVPAMLDGVGGLLFVGEHSELNANSNEQLTDREWLCNVVIRSQRDAAHGVGFRPARRQKNDRQLTEKRIRSNFPTYVPAASFGQADIEKHEVGVDTPAKLGDFFTGRTFRNSVTLLFQVVLHHGNEVCVILDQQNRLHPGNM